MVLLSFRLHCSEYKSLIKLNRHQEFSDRIYDVHGVTRIISNTSANSLCNSCFLTGCKF